jgi:hypothetical protein
MVARGGNGFWELGRRSRLGKKPGGMTNTCFSALELSTRFLHAPAPTSSPGGKAKLTNSTQTWIDVSHIGGSHALKPSCGGVVQHTTSCQQLTIGPTIPWCSTFKFFIPHSRRFIMHQCSRDYTTNYCRTLMFSKKSGTFFHQKSCLVS